MITDSDGENSSSKYRDPNRTLVNGQVVRNKARKSTTLKPRLPGGLASKILMLLLLHKTFVKCETFDSYFSL